MDALKRLMTHPLSTARFDRVTGLCVMFAGALAFLLVGMHRLAAVPLTEGEYLLGILLVLAVALLIFACGLLASIHSMLSERAKGERS